MKLLKTIILLILLSACANEANKKSHSAADSTNTSESYISGVLKIYVSEEMSVFLEKNMDEDGRVKKVGIKSIDDLFSSIQLHHLERTFPYARNFEKKTREAGLHLWYDLYFSSSIPLKEVEKTLKEIDAIEKIEYVPNVTDDISW